MKWCLALLFAIHLAMLAWNAYWNSPVCDEVGHLTAGIYKWKYAKFDLYRVNPPLVQCLAFRRRDGSSGA